MKLTNQNSSNKFIHFRTQSSYSMLESTIQIPQLIELAKSHNMNAICMADRGNLFGSLEFALEAIKHRIQPIHGAILNVVFSANQFAEILIIAKDQIGYQNLLKLVSFTFIKNDRKTCNHITLDDLVKYQEGLIVLSGYTEGIIGQLLLKKEYNAAIDEARKLVKIFGNRFYFEIMRHGLSKEQAIEAEYLEIANQLKIPLIATNQVLFDNISMHDSHDVLLCIASGVVRDEQKRKRVSNQCYFQTAESMIAKFHDLPEAIENTIYLAQRCSVSAKTYPPSLPNFSTDSASEEHLIRKDSEAGLTERLSKIFIKNNASTQQKKDITKKYHDRLSYELGVICKMNFAGYFLIVSDFIRWSKKNDISVGPGRGSGAGSIIAWSLDITDLDPIEFGLLFERFLNPERVSMPDFDIDFCQERREEVIAYVRSKYGDERVGQIITFGKLQAKAAIKDVSRVLSLPYSIADGLTELVPFNAVNPVTLKQAINEVSELKSAATGKGLYNIDGHHDLIKQVLNTALALEGLHRHASTHAAGIVISNQPMIETIPIYQDINSNMPISQYSMKYCELSGLVKFDFLGLQTLTLITKTLKLLKDHDIQVNITDISFDDKKTFDMLGKGLSTGVFQLESVGMKSALRKLIPDRIDDIIALGALYRPGPMDNIPTYIACKHGKQDPDYLHPILKSTLVATYGVIIYQEQVMEIARNLAGYSLAAADLLRRAMGKKVKAEMDAQEEIFINGAVKNKISITQAKLIFATVAKFAGYGFNKSHASAYGIISYQTAYLKANFPTEFLVASLNLDIDNSDKINIFIQEARNFNIKIITPNINKSEGLFSIEFITDNNISAKSIIYGLGAIKNVTMNFGDAVSIERSNNGPYKSIIDFVQRIDPKLLNKRLFENIIKAGCFDDIHPNRQSLIESALKILAYSASYHKEKKSNQFSLIDVQDGSSNIVQNTEEISVSDLAYHEFSVLGLFLDNHPLHFIQDLLDKSNIKNSNYLKTQLSNGSHKIKLAGIIIKKDSRMSQRGRFITLILSDRFGIFEITIYNETILKQYAHLINIKQSVVVLCNVYKDIGGERVTAISFEHIDHAIGVQNILLSPKNKSELKKIIQILQQKQNAEDPQSRNISNQNKISICLPVNSTFMATISIKDIGDLDMETLRMLETMR